MANKFSAILVLTIFIVVQVRKVSTQNNNDNILISWKGVQDLKVDPTLTPNVSGSCVNYRICSKVDNYPTEIARWVLNKLYQTKNITKYMVEKKKKLVQADIQNMACESSDESDPIEQIIYPRAALSSTDEWHFILNQEYRSPSDVDKMFQGYYTYRCLSDDQCEGIIRKINCTQQFILRTMIYLDIKNEMATINLFNVPTGCSCEYFCSD